MGGYYSTKKKLNMFKDLIYASGMTLLTFFAPAAMIIMVVFAFVFLDVITAYARVKKQRKTNKKIKWTSRAFIRGFIPKLWLYTLPILVFFMLDNILLNEFVKFFIPIENCATKLISLGFIYSEYKSINENFEVLKGKTLFQYFTDMLDFGKTVKNKIKEVNEDKDEE